MSNTTETEVNKRGKTNGYKSTVLQAKRNKKRVAAEARQRIYIDLTVQQRIDLAKTRRGESKREINRLEKLLKGK